VEQGDATSDRKIQVDIPARPSDLILR